MHSKLDQPQGHVHSEISNERPDILLTIATSRVSEFTRTVAVFLSTCHSEYQDITCTEASRAAFDDAVLAVKGDR